MVRSVFPSRSMPRLARTTDTAACIARNLPETSSSPVSIQPAERLASEPAALPHHTFERQRAVDVHPPPIHIASQSRCVGTSASSEYNCTGNPFFGNQGTYRSKPAQPLLSASLPPPTMSDAPRPLRSDPGETASPVDSTPDPLPQSHLQLNQRSEEKAPSDDAVKAILQKRPHHPPPNESSQKYVVVIDPGHGGKDPGATSNDGRLKEKEVTLRIANLIKVRLEKKFPGMTVALTRTEDAFLPVQERTAFANALNADSICLDSLQCRGGRILARD